MNAIVIHAYGGPDVLRYEQAPDFVVRTGQVLVRIAASSVNPIDRMRRSRVIKDLYPIDFPGIIGVDVAGTVVDTGPGVSGVAIGDRVFSMADRAYAELCLVEAADLVKVPDGMNLTVAAGLPLVTTTGTQLITDGVRVAAGQTVLVTGAAGSVRRWRCSRPRRRARR